VEMRSALAPDIARLAALRSRPEVVEALEKIVVRMRSNKDEPLSLQAAALEFWDTLVDGSDNLAYRFAFNTLREGYSLFMELLGEAVWEEVSNFEGYTQLAAAVRDGEAERAQAIATELMRLSGTPILALLEQTAKSTEGG
jgi:GntR family transcriptional repressor for pyruvate dehydrogenase complex